MYADASPAGRKAAQGFRDAFSVEVSIDFVGVWYVELSHLPSSANVHTFVQGYRRERRTHIQIPPFHRLQHHHRHVPSRNGARRTSRQILTESVEGTPKTPYPANAETKVQPLQVDQVYLQVEDVGSAERWKCV